MNRKTSKAWMGLPLEHATFPHLTCERLERDAISNMVAHQASIHHETRSVANPHPYHNHRSRNIAVTLVVPYSALRTLLHVAAMPTSH